MEEKEKTKYKSVDGSEISIGDIVRVKKCSCGKSWCDKFSTESCIVTKSVDEQIFLFEDPFQGDTYRDSTNYEIL